MPLQSPTCPPFTLVAKHTGIMCPATQGKPPAYLSAHVLQIRCETVHATLLQNLLASIYTKVPFSDSFIPSSLIEIDPSLYLAAIQDQNTFVKSCSIICGDGFRPGALDLPHANTTLRTIIANSKLFFRVDETFSSFRSEGRAYFVTKYSHKAKAEAFIDNTLNAHIDSLDWEQQDTLLLPDATYPARVSNHQPTSAMLTSYIPILSTTTHSRATVNFDISTQAPQSSQTTEWTQKQHPVSCHDTPKTPPKTRSTSDTSSVAESTHSASTLAALASQIPDTEALIDSKLAIFRAELESSFTSELNYTFERLVAPLIHKLDTLSTQMDEILAQLSKVSAAPPTQTPMPLNTTVPPRNSHHNVTRDQPYTSRQPDTVSAHNPSPGRPLPPQGPYLGSPITYQHLPPCYMDPYQSHAPPPNSALPIYNRHDPHPGFAAPHQSKYYQTPAHDPNNATQHQSRPASSIPHFTSFTTTNADVSMTDSHQSIMNYTLTDPYATLPDSPRPPPTALTSILKTDHVQTNAIDNHFLRRRRDG
jgi:hypothetical protein